MTELSPIRRWSPNGWTDTDDQVAVEEPLEIRLDGRTVAFALRTPGHDDELAVGYLFAEGIVERPEQIAAVEVCDGAVRVALRPGTAVDWERLGRQGALTSACGLCGKTRRDGLKVEARYTALKGAPHFAPETIAQLPQRLRAAQETFERTGGLHAAALFASDGALTVLREDVGRHNAVDKVVGRRFLEGGLPLQRDLLLVSGRASFELVQKAVQAGIPALAALGAPSSLAVALARETDTTLIGFLRADRMNVYAGAWRLEKNP